MDMTTPATHADLRAAHTPGPWWIDHIEWHVMAGEDTTRDICGVPYDWPEDRANARLIAAAPELLEALEMVRDADDDCKRDGLATIPGPARAKIDAAIAKATTA